MTDSTPKLTAAQFQALLLGSKCDGLVTTGGLVPLVTARALVKRGLLSCLEANAFLLTDAGRAALERKDGGQ